MIVDCGAAAPRGSLLLLALGLRSLAQRATFLKLTASSARTALFYYKSGSTRMQALKR